MNQKKNYLRKSEPFCLKKSLSSGSVGDIPNERIICFNSSTRVIKPPFVFVIK